MPPKPALVPKPSPVGGQACGHCTSAPKGCQWREGEDFPQGSGVFERAGAAQVCLFAGRDLEATAAPGTLTQCQYRAFWDGNPPLQEQQGRERIIHLYPQISFHPQISFPWGKDNSLPQKWGFLKETPHCELRAHGEAPKLSPEIPNLLIFSFSPPCRWVVGYL